MFVQQKLLVKCRVCDATCEVIGDSRNEETLIRPLLQAGWTVVNACPEWGATFLDAYCPTHDGEATYGTKYQLKEAS